MSSEISEYTKEGKHLPGFMKDFHDQKDLFKAIHTLYSGNDGLKKLPNSWCDNHVFVIDYFLWFMAQHGYKLQKTRSHIQFHDIHETIKKFNDIRIGALCKILQQPDKK